jgi:hypothetical protein
VAPVIALEDGKDGQPVDALSFGQARKAVCAQQGFLRWFVRILLDCIQAPKPFQAEYGGSIPLTRSSLFNDLGESVGFHSDKSAALRVLNARFPIDCFACLLIRCRIPRSLWPTEVRVHQNRISWFGDGVLNPRVEIGDDGVKIGQVEHQAQSDPAVRLQGEVLPEHATTVSAA